MILGLGTIENNDFYYHYILLIIYFPFSKSMTALCHFFDKLFVCIEFGMLNVIPIVCIIKVR